MLHLLLLAVAISPAQCSARTVWWQFFLLKGHGQLRAHLFWFVKQGEPFPMGIASFAHTDFHLCKGECLCLSCKNWGPRQGATGKTWHCHNCYHSSKYTGTSVQVTTCNLDNLVTINSIWGASTKYTGNTIAWHMTQNTQAPVSKPASNKRKHKQQDGDTSLHP